MKSDECRVSGSAIPTRVTLELPSNEIVVLVPLVVKAMSSK